MATFAAMSRAIESAIAKAVQKRRIAMRGQSTTRSKLSHQFKFWGSGITGSDRIHVWLDI